MQKENIKKGIYILPNLFTSMNMFCGYYAVLAAVNARYEQAAVSILIGAVFDLLDGKIARATHTTSRFGIEYDSLADLVTFGLAPSLLMVLWVLEPIGRLGWLAGFLFAACGALRLARFNTTVEVKDSGSFEGLPIPAAACMNVAVVMLFSRLGADPEPYRLVILFMLYALSFCMVSSFGYKSFKNISLFNRTRFNWLVGAILVLITVAYEPWLVLFAVMSVYVISGPVLAPFHHHEERESREEVGL
ncbi:MAG: CDP-diacylglycerol--serine O-phosphatidyltransferase [Desulfarculaceae bacterium]|nr:CDP-diacylglycerol--serine O-phosphatidyltransferase [Desulfarculaceae bacterium]